MDQEEYKQNLFDNSTYFSQYRNRPEFDPKNYQKPQPNFGYEHDEMLCPAGVNKDNRLDEKLKKFIEVKNDGLKQKLLEDNSIPNINKNHYSSFQNKNNFKRDTYYEPFSNFVPQTNEEQLYGLLQNN